MSIIYSKQTLPFSLSLIYKSTHTHTRRDAPEMKQQETKETKKKSFAFFKSNTLCKSTRRYKRIFLSIHLLILEIIRGGGGLTYCSLIENKEEKDVEFIFS